MLTPQPYLTILRLEREAKEGTPRYLREFEELLLEGSPAPAVKEDRRRRLRGLVLNLRAFLF